MTPINYAATDDAGPSPWMDAERRKKARRRSWMCLGAGLALIGNGTYAIAFFVASFLIVPAVAWVALQPTAASFWTLVATVVFVHALSVVEQIAIKKSDLRKPSPRFLDRGFIVCTCTIWSAIALATGLTMTSFGTLRMAGGGMKPTLEEGERLIYHKHVDWQSVKRDAILVYKNARDSAWGQPGWIVVARVLAGPGDDLSIQNGNYVVNGVTGPPVADAGKSAVVLDIPSSPETRKVPDDCYFIVQDSPTTSFDSRVLSWVKADDVISSRLWYLSGRNFGKPVE